MQQPRTKNKQLPSKKKVKYLLGVGVAMMGTMVAAPPANGSLHGSSRGEHQDELKSRSSRVGAMGPETMVSYCTIERNEGGKQLVSDSRTNGDWATLKVDNHLGTEFRTQRNEGRPSVQSWRSSRDNPNHAGEQRKTLDCTA